MAKAKLITIDRPTSVTREAVREVVTKTQQEMSGGKQPKETNGQSLKKKKA